MIEPRLKRELDGLHTLPTPTLEEQIRFYQVEELHDKLKVPRAVCQEVIELIHEVEMRLKMKNNY